MMNFRFTPSRFIPKTAIALFILVLASLELLAQDQVLQGRPDVVDANTPVELDPPFVSEAAGISISPPAGGKMIRRGGNGDELVRFINETDKWSLVVSRIVLSEGVPLVTADAAAASRNPSLIGFVDTAIQQMPSDTPGKLLRFDLIPVAGLESALLASRFSVGVEKRLQQQAIVRRTDRFYFIISLTTAAGKGDVEIDPRIGAATRVFREVIDSIQVLDQDAIRSDQEDRLIRTRSLLINLATTKLQSVLINEQWLRLQVDGKDVGYSYIVEEPANDLPRRGQPANANTDRVLGLRIGVRSRSYLSPGESVDAESWMWISNDRKQEAFSNQVVSVDPTGKKNFALELGRSTKRLRPVADKFADDQGNKGVTSKEQYTLEVWSTGSRAALPPIKRDLPPWYLPQAVGHLLPRLLPINEPRTYMFATYLTDNREVITRYIDVLPATEVSLGGTKRIAIPVQDKLGLEGTVTTHYVSLDRKYLGSINPASKVTILATDANTLEQLWKDADLTRPAEVNETP